MGPLQYDSEELRLSSPKSILLCGDCKLEEFNLDALLYFWEASTWHRAYVEMKGDQGFPGSLNRTNYYFRDIFYKDSMLFDIETFITCVSSELRDNHKASDARDYIYRPRLREGSLDAVDCR